MPESYAGVLANRVRQRGQSAPARRWTGLTPAPGGQGILLPAAAVNSPAAVCHSLAPIQRFVPARAVLTRRGRHGALLLRAGALPFPQTVRRTQVRFLALAVAQLVPVPPTKPIG